jgi:hypothetical protein
MECSELLLLMLLLLLPPHSIQSSLPAVCPCCCRTCSPSPGVQKLLRVNGVKGEGMPSSLTNASMLQYCGDVVGNTTAAAAAAAAAQYEGRCNQLEC